MLRSVPDILAKIADYKRDEVEQLKTQTSLTALRREAEFLTPAKDFVFAIRQTSQSRPALIAEVKKASPSKGLIRADFDPQAIARSYETGGAACLSVLTDEPGFQGSKDIFATVRKATTLPLLRKDFMLDPIQIAEARVMGADAILVILAMVDDKTAKALMNEARHHGMAALVETHDESELERALALGANLIGINNRNLRTFETSLETFHRLAPYVPSSTLLIAESGIFTRHHLEDLTASGANGFLIGESLMRQQDVEGAIKELTGL